MYQAFVMDEVFGKMEGSNAAIAMYYAGDYLTMLDNNPDLKFVVPEEGSNWFVDAMSKYATILRIKPPGRRPCAFWPP